VPEAPQIIVFFFVGLAARLAWRYVERALDWIEPRAAKHIPGFGLPVLRAVTANPWPVIIVPALVGIIGAAFRGYWTAVWAGLGGGVVGFIGGFALRQAEDSGWVPRGAEHVLFGVGFLSVAGLLIASLAFEVSPWWGFASIVIAPPCLVEIWQGVQMARHSPCGGS